MASVSSAVFTVIIVMAAPSTVVVVGNPNFPLVVSIMTSMPGAVTIAVPIAAVNITTRYPNFYSDPLVVAGRVVASIMSSVGIGDVMMASIIVIENRPYDDPSDQASNKSGPFIVSLCRRWLKSESDRGK